MTDVSQITCFGSVQQLGIARENLLFSWQLSGDRRNVQQLQYQLQLATDMAFSQQQYDSGWVASEQSVNVALSNFIPVSRTRYYFRVRIMDNAGSVSNWSQAGWFETALLTSQEWKASWITPETDHEPEETVALLRRCFAVEKQLVSARLYSTALGIYQLWLNGQPVSDELFSPGWTSYDDHLQFQSWDITPFLQQGENVIGVALAEGWYKGELSWLKKRELYGDKKAFLGQIHLTYSEGEQRVIGSDQHWQCGSGAIVRSGFYSGESWDARLEDARWQQPAAMENWREVALLKRHYRLVPQISEPVRVTQTLSPVSVQRTPHGRIIIDMGQNMVGRLRLQTQLAEGAEVILRHAEVLDREGELYSENLRNARQTVHITGNGQAINYAPTFSFQGFRYVEIEGLSHLDESALRQAIRGEVLHSDMLRTGEFSCDNPQINQLFSNIVWGQRGNFVDVPTDCPQRDERLGWTGDAHIFIRTASCNYNVHRFFRKWLMSVAADQKQNGTVPMVVPDVLRDYISKIWGDETYTSSGWGDAAVICPWTLWQVYGDKQLLAEQYPSMKAWVHYIHQSGDDPWLWDSGFQFGDWLALDAEPDSYFGATPVFLVATAFYAWSTRLLARAAAALGFIEEAAQYQRWFDTIAERFRATFMQHGAMIADTQTSHILPLAFDLLPEAERQPIADRLHSLVIDNGCHLTTGFLGTPWLCSALSQNGHHATAVQLVSQTRYPSWLFSVEQGATTIWEHWDGIKPDGSFWSKNMNSFNHYAYGAIGEWFYRFVAGIDFAADSVAWNKIVFRPDLSATGFSSASATYDSPRGQIAINWSLKGNSGEIALTVPANAVAILRLPPHRDLQVQDKETGERWPGKLTAEGRELNLGSGKYLFQLSGLDTLAESGRQLQTTL